MATQAFAQEAETPSEQNLDTVIDVPHGEPVEGATGHDPAAEHHGTEVGADAHDTGVFPPFDPATFPSQLLWLAITFAALYLLMSKLALPRLGSIIDERKARLDADLAAADASRQKTDAAIAAYEAALAAAKSKAQGIANETRESIQTELAAKRQAVETDLAARMTSAEARIAQTKAAALTQVDEIAAATAQTIVAQLVGEVSPESVRAAVAKVGKE
ncbi:MAG: synthase subunit [Devosia sp.]|jgi:F-type H+-transporting ATPase subunit b|nr:synthase subunit [Devosia sp.]